VPGRPVDRPESRISVQNLRMFKIVETFDFSKNHIRAEDKYGRVPNSPSTPPPRQTQSPLISLARAFPARQAEIPRLNRQSMSHNGLRRSVALLKQLRNNGLQYGAPTSQTANIGEFSSKMARGSPHQPAPYGARFVSLKHVQQRMKSVGNIQKITAAMKMVASSRLKAAQTRMVGPGGFYCSHPILVTLFRVQSAVQ